MSGVSAFKNAVTRRIHKERAQPYSRQKLGMLEKHKDYKLRAKDYHRKQDEINRLKNVASFKNPDEFYFKMNSSSTIDGVHVIKRDNSKDHNTVTNWKQQDAAWLQMKLTQTIKQIDKMQACLHNISSTDKPNEVEEESDSDAGNDDDTSLGRRPTTRMKIVDELEDVQKFRVEYKNSLINKKKVTTSKADKMFAKKMERYAAKQKADLAILRARRDKLDKALKAMQLQRALMAGKGTVQKIVTEDKFGEEDKEKTVYRWKLQRTR